MRIYSEPWDTDYCRKRAEQARVFLGRNEWRHFSAEEMKQFKSDVFDYYRRHGFPYRMMSAEQRMRHYQQLLRFDSASLLKGDLIDQVILGLGLVGSYHPHSWNVRCGDRPSPLELFNSEKFREVIDDIVKYANHISDSGLRGAMRWAADSQAVSNFRPTAAAAIYYELLPASGGTTWDMSTGFGGRLLGALICRRVKRYIGTDPCKLSYEGSRQMGEELNRGKLVIELNQCGSEVFRPDRRSVDLCFTSPPYFNTEKYSEEETQSYLKYPTREMWMQGFLRDTIKNCAYCLKDDGLLAINIANVRSYKTLEDDLHKMMARDGWRLVRVMQLRLSRIIGTYTKNGEVNPGKGHKGKDNLWKTEPIFVYVRR